jgi:methionine-rich copper-binding protein CopC
MKVRSLIGIMLASILAGLSGPANARLDPQSQASDPPEARRANLVLAFSQRVDAKASGVQIRDSHGALVAIGDLRTSKDGTDLEIPLSAPLGPDVYTIRWRAVSSTGIVDVGGYDFRIDAMPGGVPAVAQQ